MFGFVCFGWMEERAKVYEKYKKFHKFLKKTPKIDTKYYKKD